MAKPIPNISLRGIRASIPSGYLIGRQSQGKGPPELIPVSSLLSGQGVSGGGGGGGGATALSALTDVTVTEGSGIDGYTLNWNNTAGVWEAVAPVAAITSNEKIASISWVIDGAGTALTTGVTGYLLVPFACTITQATLLADQSGSVVVNVWKCSYSNFDAGTTHPLVGDKITSSTPPTISSATKAQDGTLSSWTTAISAGDILAFNIDSASTITRVTLTLKVTKS